MGKLHPADLFFTFAEIEDALARIHGIGADDRLMFRGRFHHLQKIGLFRIAKGRGSRLHYSLEEAYRAAFFMELIECGIGPSHIARLVGKLWHAMEVCLRSEGGGEAIVVFSPRLLDRHFPENVEPYQKGFLQICRTKAELSRAITHEMGTRVIAVNVRLLREKLHAELNVDALQERQLLEREKRLADPEWPPIRRSETRAETRKVKRAATSSRTLS